MVRLPWSSGGSTATINEKEKAGSHANFDQWYESYKQIKTQSSRARRMVWVLASEHFDWLPMHLSNRNVPNKQRIEALNDVMLESEAFTRNLPSEEGVKRFAELIGPNANLLGEALSNGVVAKGFAHGLGARAGAFGKGLGGYVHTFAAALTRDGTGGFAQGLGKNARAFGEGLGVNISLFFGNIKYKTYLYDGLGNNMPDFFASYGKNVGFLASSLSHKDTAYEFTNALGKNAKEFAEGMGKNAGAFAANFSAESTKQFALGLGKHVKYFAWGLDGNALIFFMNLGANASVFIKTLREKDYWDEFKSGMNQEDVAHLRGIVPKESWSEL